MSLLMIERVGAWWLTALAHFLWQGTMIWLMTAVAMYGLRRHRASLRYAVLCAAFCAIAACVPVTLVVLQPPDMAEALSRETAQSAEPAGAGAAPIDEVDRSTASRDGTTVQELSGHFEDGFPSESVRNETMDGRNRTAIEPDADGRSAVAASTEAGLSAGRSNARAEHLQAELAQTPTLRRWLVPTVATYAICVVVMLARLALGLAGGLGLRRAAKVVSDSELLSLVAKHATDLGLSWTPAVAWCEQVAVPTVVGVLRPMVLLPVSLSTGLTPEQLSVMLTHELAHIRRYDHFVNLLQRLVEAILFFHPAVWCLSRWMRLEREHCCDDLVVRLGGSRVTYADSLLRVAELSHGTESSSPMTASVLLAATGNRSQLARRIVRLLEGPAQPPLRLSRGAGVVLVLLPWLLLFSPLWLQIRAESPGETPPAAIQPDGADPAPADRSGREVPAAEGEANGDEDPQESAEAIVPQVFFWSMLVNEKLAERLGELGEKELPRQAAFRVLRFDAGKLRELLFATDARPHVLSDIRSPRALRIATDPTSKDMLSEFSSFNLSQASSQGRLYGEYVSFPGQPFDLRVSAAELDIHALEGYRNEQYQIEPQSLEFRGDLPVGRAVVFTAKAESKKGTKSFHPVFVFEALPKASDQYLRMISDPMWFKAGHARITELLDQADEFNRLADPMPDEVPERWKKTLPHGGSVSLVAVARPKTHPFCWWDADGQPRSTEWQLRQHAFGRVDVLALICVRDPTADYAPRGAAYVMGGNHAPVRLFTPWKSLADSELHLFSVTRTDADGLPQIRVNFGAGPWKELGRLKPKEEVTLGRADYMLGEPRSASYRDNVSLHLGRRYLSDLDVRLRLLDKQGRFVSTRNSSFSGRLTDASGMPEDWPGHEYLSAKIKLDDVDQYVLESRPRHSTTISRFATQLAPADATQPPRLRLKRVESSPLSDQLADQLEQVLSEERFQYFREEDQTAIVADFRRFAARYTPTVASQHEVRTLAEGLSRVKRDLSSDYLRFFPTYRDMKWRVWMALNRRELSPEELARRETQREEMREFIRQIPHRNFVVPRTHGDAIARLEQLFDDPWFGWFHEPMTDDEVTWMQKHRKQWNFHEPWTAPSSLSTIVWRTKKTGMQDDSRFGTGAMPLDAEVVAGMTSELFRFHARFADQKSFYGLRDLVYDDSPKPGRRVLDFHRDFVEPPRDVPPGLDALRAWSAEENLGVMAYDATRHVLVALRGAKLAVLSLKSWSDADRIGDDDLRHMAQERATDEIVLTDHFGERPKNRGYGAGYPGRPLLGVESPEGEIGVIDIESVSKSGVTVHLRPRPVMDE